MAEEKIKRTRFIIGGAISSSVGAAILIYNLMGFGSSSNRNGLLGDFYTSDIPVFLGYHYHYSNQIGAMVGMFLFVFGLFLWRWKNDR